MILRGLMLSTLALGAIPASFGQTPLPAQRVASDVQPLRRTASPQYQSLPEPIAAPQRTNVTWDSRGLQIEASNSSLNQILRQVAISTGAKLEGLSQDQRIFGTYGPGPASEVLLQLLEGSGYNLVITGGRAADPPLAIALSARLLTRPQTAANNLNHAGTTEADSSEPEPEPQPEESASSSQPEAAPNPFTNGNADLPQDPERFMQAVLQRQQKTDEEQRQQDGQNNPQ